MDEQMADRFWNRRKFVAIVNVLGSRIVLRIYNPVRIDKLAEEWKERGRMMSKYK